MNEIEIVKEVRDLQKELQQLKKEAERIFLLSEYVNRKVVGNGRK